MKQAWRKLGILALTLMTALTLLPVSALAVDIGTGEELVVDPLKNLADGNTVYYGVDGYNSDTPLLWRVVKNDSTSGLILFADDIVYTDNGATRQYDPSAHNSWSGSDVCAWLNGTGSYTASGFLPKAFSAAEVNAIAAYGATETGGYETININQQIVLPSVSEMDGGDGWATGEWGFNWGDRTISTSDHWWLRSPGPYNDFAAVVLPNGSVDAPGNYVLTNNGVRPAFKLDLSSVLFTSAAAGGKSGAAGPELSAATPPTGAVKLTVSDSGLTFSATTTGLSGRTVTFSYTASATAPSTYNTLSAVITDSTGATVKYYGKLVANPGATGTASVTLPDDYADGDILIIFVEQANADYYTDFASGAVEFTFTNSAKSAPAVTATGETAALVDGILEGTTNDMEYSSDGGQTWTAATAPQTSGLAPGTYLVRYAASGTTLASPATTVTVGAFQQITTPTTPGGLIIGNTGGTLTFTNRTLTDSATGVKVTGSFVSGAKLGVTKNALHKEGACAACDEIRERMRADSLIVLYDISATGHKGDGVSVTIPLGNGYDGRLLSVLHCDHGKLEEKILTCADGAVTGVFNSLSPFAVFDGVSVATPDEVVVDAPKTGDSGLAWVGAVFLLCALVAINRKLKMENDGGNSAGISS